MLRDAPEPVKPDPVALENVADLHPTVKKYLIKAGIKELFPVQVATLEKVLNGNDVVVRSRTGSGKTLAFAIPIQNALVNQDRSSGRAKVLVVAPTRELALQVHSEFERTAPWLRSVAVYGGASIRAQSNALRKGVDVIVGTPGRLIDMTINRGDIRLSDIQ